MSWIHKLKMKPNKESFWGEVFSDIDGTFSFKRVQNALFTVLFCIAVIGNMFWRLQIDPGILGCLSGLVAYSYTGIAMEKFGKRDP